MPDHRLVHIVDADADRSQLLKRLLRAAGLTAVVYETADAVLEAAPILDAGCLLVNLATPGLDRSTLQTLLKRLDGRLPVIAASSIGNVTMAVDAMKDGAIDFIEGPADDRRLLAAIEAALADPQDEADTGDSAQAARRLAMLSTRERQVLGEIVAGRPNKLIAHKLAISIRTVEVHRANLLDRLGVRTTAEAIRLAVLATLMGSSAGDTERPLSAAKKAARV